MSETKLPSCKYGTDCYRKNPIHFKEFSHDKEPLLGKRNIENTNDMEVKRKKLANDTVSHENKHPSNSSDDQPSTSRQEHIKGTISNSSKKSHQTSGGTEAMSPITQVSLSEKCTKYSYYLTNVHRSIDSSYNQGSALTLHNVINGTKAELHSSCLFSYMFDLEWIRQQFKPADRQKPMTIVEGLKGDSHLELMEQRGSRDNIKIVQAKMDIPYGVHHTKMVILRYDTGIRIMITTANLIPLDWFQKTQALWCSPLCPPGEGDSTTNFKSDLIEYLSAYRSRLVNEWIEVIRQHDMSKCRVFLIASVPGRHTGQKKSLFGHLKLRQTLKQHGPAMEASSWPVIGQFSSIGKLGTSAAAWLHGELLTSLSTTKGSISAGAKPDMKLVFPTVENVRTSLEGYQAGGSLPFNQQTYDQQRYIKAYMHQWKSDLRGRSRASPHIKTYLRLSLDNKTIPWFLMTSSNLSKAAWGVLEKQESQLMIRSYELGVLFLPKMYDLDTFVLDSSFADDRAFPVPFDLPLTPYSDADEPWIVNRRYTDKCDSVGDYWNPFS